MSIYRMEERSIRGDSPDSIGYIEEDHPLRPSLAVQSVRLLQVPPRDEDNKRSFSLTSSLTDMDVPIFTRETHFSRRPRTGLTFNLAFAILASAVGSAFQHGYNTGVVNAPQEVLLNWTAGILRNESINSGGDGIVNGNTVELIWAVVVSIFCIGGMIGGMLTGIVSNTFGPKKSILLNSLLVFVAALFLGRAKSNESYYMLIFGRLVIGINAGLNAGLAPLYLSEIPPTNLRGAVGTVYQLVITISILISQVLGLSDVLGTSEYWPILFSLIAIPSVVQIVTLPFCAESPKFLASAGNDQKAQSALSWLRSSTDVNDELEEMKTEYDAQRLLPKVTLSDMLNNRMLRMPLMIAVVVMIAQQLSGINAVIFYSTKIFKTAKLSDTASQFATLTIGVMNVFMTMISLFLVEIYGRKTLLLVGFGGMCIDTILLGIVLIAQDYVSEEVLQVTSYFSVLLVVAFVVLFAVGPGSIPWFLVSELFNQSARPMAISIAVAVNWTANFLVGLAFLPIMKLLRGYVFVLFAILQAIFLLFIYKKVPETKNKTVEEISALFRQISYQ